MSWLVSLLPTLTNLLPQVIAIWNESSGNTLQKVQSFLQTELGAGSQALTAIEQEAAAVFPKIAPELQAAAAVLTAAFQHSGVIYWLQDGLNLAQTFGIVTYNPPLVVDGTWGPKTMAALTALQSKFGLPATGVLTDTENNILTAIASGGLGGAIGGLFDTLIADIKKL